MASPLLRFVFAPSSGDDENLRRGQRNAGPPLATSALQSSSPELYSLDRIRAGDPAAFDALFRAEYATLVDFAAAWAHAPELADEIVVDVFLWLYEHRATITPRTTLPAYIMGAVRHRALNVKRGTTRAILRHNALAAESHESVVPRPSPTPEEAYLTSEAERLQARQLAAALESLPQTTRSVLLLRAHNEMSYAEIGEALGMSANAAKTQFSRGVAALRRTFGRDSGSAM